MSSARQSIRVFCLIWASAAAGAHGAELPRSTPAAEGLSTERLQAVGETMRRLVDERRIAGGVVMIARHGKVVFDEQYGQMSLEAKRPMERDTIFRIYSMSKAITSAAALMLVDEGKLDLGAPVAQYLPGFEHMTVADGDQTRPAERAMTVADLFLHTSGIPYGSETGDLVERRFAELDVLDTQSSLAEMAAKLGRIPLTFEPGADWKYGASVDVLGRVVEVVSGRPLDEFLEERIFVPLGMIDTAFYVPEGKQSRFATNYAPDSDGGLKILDAAHSSRYLQKPGLFSGGGGLVGTAPDYMRFLLMVQGGGVWDGKRVLSEESVKRMTTNQLPERAGWVTFGDEVRTGVGFGLGFSVTTAVSDGRQDEYGWGGAASTHYWVSPRDGLVVVTMEQRMPYTSETEDLLKPVIYGAIKD